MLAMGLIPAAAIADPPGERKPNIPVLSDAEAWRTLPAVENGGGQPLPSWARALAGPMPRTTAALLRLDFVQRTRNPIDPKLRASMRWVAAKANGSAYSQAYALADARRAGLDDAAIAALERGDHSKLSAGDRAALVFARKMTLESSKVTDAEFSELVGFFGEDKVVAMVLLLAYSNFQDRLLACLGSPLEPGGPLAPVDVVFDPSATQSKMLSFPKSKTELSNPSGKDVVEDEPGWGDVGYDALQEKLELQRNKTTRVRVPTWDEVVKGLPKSFAPNRRPVRIVWTLVCLGHQPELASAWETLMRTAGAESRGKLDRVLAQGLFWIVTKTVDCPYCMGHCEMNWEVAGLTKPEIAERSKLLAGDDWSAFPPEEQRVFAFARKLTRSPASITREDVDGIVRDYGLEKGVNILVYASRCNYMVRVSNGFQLSLERDNVFFDYYSDDKAQAAPASERSGR
jgi:alkylhydroperoxidase family enzyme